MKTANLIKFGIAARHRWQMMGNSTRVMLIDKDQRDLTLVVWPLSHKAHMQYCERTGKEPISYPPESEIEEEHVRLEQWATSGESIWMGYGPKTDALVVADPE